MLSPFQENYLATMQETCEEHKIQLRDDYCDWLQSSLTTLPEELMKRIENTTTETADIFWSKAFTLPVSYFPSKQFCLPRRLNFDHIFFKKWVFVRPSDVSFFNFENILDDVEKIQQFNKHLESLYDNFYMKIIEENKWITKIKIDDRLNSLFCNFKNAGLAVKPFNDNERGGLRFIFRSRELSELLTKTLKSLNKFDKCDSFDFVRVNDIFRWNYFPPNGDDFRWHYDSPYFDRQAKEISVKSLVMYASISSERPCLRIISPNDDDNDEYVCLENGTAVLFDSDLPHEGYCAPEHDKIFVRTELIYRYTSEESIKHLVDNKTMDVFAKACHASLKAMNYPNLKEYSRELFLHYNNLRLGKTTEFEMKKDLWHYLKTATRLRFATNGNLYVFPLCNNVMIENYVKTIIRDAFVSNSPYIKHIKSFHDDAKSLAKVSELFQDVTCTCDYLHKHFCSNEKHKYTWVNDIRSGLTDDGRECTMYCCDWHADARYTNFNEKFAPTLVNELPTDIIESKFSLENMSIDRIGTIGTKSQNFFRIYFCRKADFHYAGLYCTMDISDYVQFGRRKYLKIDNNVYIDCYKDHEKKLFIFDANFFKNNVKFAESIIYTRDYLSEDTTDKIEFTAEAMKYKFRAYVKSKKWDIVRKALIELKDTLDCNERDQHGYSALCEAVSSGADDDIFDKIVSLSNTESIHAALEITLRRQKWDVASKLMQLCKKITFDSMMYEDISVCKDDDFIKQLLKRKDISLFNLLEEAVERDRNPVLAEAIIKLNKVDLHAQSTKCSYSYSYRSRYKFHIHRTLWTTAGQQCLKLLVENDKLNIKKSREIFLQRTAHSQAPS